MVISDPLKSMARHSVQDDVLSVSSLSVSWHDDSNLLDIVSWILIASPISGSIKAQGNVTILLWRDVSHQMDRLLIKSNSRMVSVQHVLKGTKDDGIQISIKWIARAMPESIGKDVKLRVYGCPARWREQRANSVNEFSMELEGVRCTTVIDRVIHLSASRSHGQSTVVVANLITKGAVRSAWCGEILIEDIGDVLKRWEGDCPLIAAHAKLGVKVGGVRKSFNSPVQSMARGTLNIHLPKAVDHPVRIKRLARNR
jgi:hypothetical protein